MTSKQPSNLPLGSPQSAEQAYTRAQQHFKDLEAEGITDFQIFNALADLFYKRGRPDLSELMAEAAYRCFDRE